jgi:hydrogenase nickel incorporation protein HypA/HybF
MHELSIARSLIEVATEQLGPAESKTEAGYVSAVKVRIGVLSGVVPEALRTAFEMAAVGTDLDGASLEIEQVDLAVWCPDCAAERVLPDTRRLSCPACNAPTPRIVRGRELELVSIEVADAAENRGSTTAHS